MCHNPDYFIPERLCKKDYDSERSNRSNKAAPAHYCSGGATTLDKKRVDGKAGGSSFDRRFGKRKCMAWEFSLYATPKTFANENQR
jgi:hypothetical protein